MIRILKIFLIVVFTSACEIIDVSTLDNLKFSIDSKTIELNSKAYRNRDHKNISLKINSEDRSKNIGIPILVDNYTDVYHYKNMPDSNLINHDDVKFIILSRNYYESESGWLLILKDDDKQIKGKFEFTAVNALNPNDKKEIKNGSFDINYSESTTTQKHY